MTAYGQAADSTSKLSLPNIDPPLFAGLMPLSVRSGGEVRRREEGR
jgi:hypothetical protein